MSMPPRQPRPAMVGGTPSRHGPPPNLDGMSFEQITQRALDISRKLEPAIRYFPAVGPALDMADDLRDGDYGGALFNGAMLAADLTPIGPVAKTGSTMFKLYRRYGRGLASAQAMQKRLKTLGLTRAGMEVHHTVPLNGAGRNVKGDFRNHVALLKPMPKVTHRRLTGKWTDPVTGEVLQQFNAAQRAWHGTNALQKTTAAAAAATTADWGENVIRDSGKSDNPRRR